MPNEQKLLKKTSQRFLTVCILYRHVIQSEVVFSDIIMNFSIGLAL